MSLKEYPFVYKSWRDVDTVEFRKRWPNFSPQEMACRGTGKVAFNFASMDKLQALRTKLGRPIIINSAYRSPSHNRAVGGAKSSQHLKAKAFDGRQDNQDPAQYLAAAKAVGFTSFGTYPKSNFIHVDDRASGRSWGNPFPKRNTPLPVETVMQPETLSEDKGAKGAVAGATGIVATAIPVFNGIGNLDPTSQALAVGGLIVGILACVYIFRDSLKKLR